MTPADSAHAIALSDDGKYIILRVTGDMEPRRALEAIIEAHKFGREVNVKRYLCDFRQCRNIGSVYENYSFAYDYTEISPEVDNSARVAMLISPDDGSHEFSIAVGANSGKNLTPFTNLDAAVNHLIRD